MALIQTLDDPRLTPFLGLRDQGSRFVAEGERVLGHLIKSPLHIYSLLGTEERVRRFRQSHPHAERIGECLTASPELFKEMLGYRFHAGVMALAEKPVYHSIASLGSHILILNGLTNAENVGSVVRNAVALAPRGQSVSLLLDQQTPDPYLRRAVRVSMGGVFQTQISVSQNLIKDMERLKTLGYCMIGSSARETSKTAHLGEFRWPQRYALVIGAEGEGMTPEVKEACDVHLRISTFGMTSLNAATAAAVMLFDAHRKDGMALNH